MKLNYLKINGYKNLKTKAVFDDIENCENYLALIGLNGSGKSNVLEAVSKIFASVYKSSALDFSYEIRYTLNGNNVSIIDGNVTSGGNSITKKNINTFLPEQIIACYSGEELRMWEETYEAFYSEFFNAIKKQTSFVPKLLYLNKYAWDIALIALLCSDDAEVLKFLKDKLKIEVKPEIEIEFNLNVANKAKFGTNQAINLINRIEAELIGNAGRISINTLKTFNIGQTDNADLVKKIFYYLFICFMPSKSKKIKSYTCSHDILSSSKRSTWKNCFYGISHTIKRKTVSTGATGYWTSVHHHF